MGEGEGQLRYFMEKTEGENLVALSLNGVQVNTAFSS